jgi:hypothetical protein
LGKREDTPLHHHDFHGLIDLSPGVVPDPLEKDEERDPKE